MDKKMENINFSNIYSNCLDTFSTITEETSRLDRETMMRVIVVALPILIAGFALVCTAKLLYRYNITPIRLYRYIRGASKSEGSNKSLSNSSVAQNNHPSTPSRESTDGDPPSELTKLRMKWESLKPKIDTGKEAKALIGTKKKANKILFSSKRYQSEFMRRSNLTRPKIKSSVKECKFLQKFNQIYATTFTINDLSDFKRTARTNIALFKSMLDGLSAVQQLVKNQEFLKTQGPQTLKIRRHLPRLSLLKSSGGKILIYTTVCQCGRPMGKSFRRVGSGRILSDCVVGFGGRSRGVNETEDDRCTFGEMQVRATEKTGLDVTTLLRPLDQTSGFEVLETAVERALRLHRALGEKLTTGEDVIVWVRRIDGEGEGGENGAGARRDAIKARRTMNSPQNDPRQIDGVRAESNGIVADGRGCFDVPRRHGTKSNLASNEMLRDSHSKSLPFAKMDLKKLDSLDLSATLRAVRSGPHLFVLLTRLASGECHGPTCS